jgi:hypothetical protein
MKTQERSIHRTTNRLFGMRVTIGIGIFMICGSVSLAGLQSAGQVNSQPSTYRILWDISHGILLDYQPSGSFQPLVQNLESHGFSVDTSSQGFLVDDPTDYDVLVLCRACAINSFYAPAEVARITEFVYNGGGLLIMGDNPSSLHHIQPVASIFGVSLGLSAILPSDTYTSNLASHPIFEGVSQIYMRAAGEISAVGVSSEIAWQEGTGKVLVAVGSYGYGRVVTLGDQNIWAQTMYYDLVDNRQFSINTFEFLAVPEPGTILLMGLGGLAFRLKRS